MTKTKESSPSVPFSLDDLANIEYHKILVEKQDLRYAAQHPNTFVKIRNALTLIEGQYYLEFPKLYCLSAGESSEIDKLTVSSTENTLNYQLLIQEISERTGLKPNIVQEMMGSPWDYAAKYPILNQKKQEIVRVLGKMQASDRNQAEVTICIKHRLIENWTSIDTQRLSVPLLNKIREYLIYESRGWKALENSLTAEDRAFLASQKTKFEQLPSGDESENPTQALNPSSKALPHSNENSTLEVAAIAS